MRSPTIEVSLLRKDQMFVKDPRASEDDLKAWIDTVGSFVDPIAPNEQNLINLFSDAIRETDPMARADAFVALANMSLAMADMALGSLDYVVACLMLSKH